MINNNNKQKFFVDFDLTIVNSIKAFCEVYNIFYKNHPDFIPADPNKIDSYDFRCVCPLLQDSEDKMAIWGSKLLFDSIEFIDKDAVNVLKELNNKYKLIVCSIGTPSNISYKSQWLEWKLPFIQDYILLVNHGCKMDKSIVNMNGSGSIFMDDIISNLESTNAERKILFGKIYPWNSGWNGEHCLNWEQVGRMFL